MQKYNNKFDHIKPKFALFHKYQHTIPRNHNTSNRPFLAQINV